MQDEAQAKAYAEADFAAPGASVFVMDLLRPESPEAAQSLVDRYAAGEPEILRRDFYGSLLAAYTPTELETQLRHADFSHLRLEIVSDRHFVVSGRIDGVPG